MAFKEYKKEDLTIMWDASKCTHSAFCAKGLPEVFKPREKPWVQIENSSVQKIKNQVFMCPSKALSIK